MGKLKADPKQRRRVFLREWRDHKGLTLEQVAAELNITASMLSRHERGAAEYTRPLLEALATIYGCEPGDLIMRNPEDMSAPWSIWDHAQPAQREQIISMMRIIVGEKTGTDG
jgi:transcriptional regulator with XRE-family HTH domain